MNFTLFVLIGISNFSKDGGIPLMLAAEQGLGMPINQFCGSSYRQFEPACTAMLARQFKPDCIIQ